MTIFRYASQLVCVLLLSVAVVLTGTHNANAQGGTGQIKGIVTDSSGAVISSAKVTAVSLETGFTRVTVSGGDGAFLIPLVPPGHYQVEVLAANFERLVRGPITVQVAEAADVGNLALKIGSQSTTVTVSGEAGQAELLQTESPTLGKVFDSTLIEAMPLSTRNFTQLLSLQAGVIGAIPGTLALGNGTSQFSVGGARVYDNSVNIDGVNAVSSSSSGSYSVPSPDALQEFKMQTSTYSAEYSRAGGGSIDVTTKGGSNHFHGDGFYFFRNKALDANSYFNKQAEAQTNSPNIPPDIRQNQWGGTVGGPIKRDKMFFFFSYQSTNQINGNAGNIINDVYPLLPPGDRSNTGLLRQQLGAIYGGDTITYTYVWTNGITVVKTTPATATLTDTLDLEELDIDSLRGLSLQPEQPLVTFEETETFKAPDAFSMGLAPEDISRARSLADRRGLRYQTYLKMLIHEALEREERLAS